MDWAREVVAVSRCSLFPFLSSLCGSFVALASSSCSKNSSSCGVLSSIDHAPLAAEMLTNDDLRLPAAQPLHMHKDLTQTPSNSAASHDSGDFGALTEERVDLALY